MQHALVGVVGHPLHCIAEWQPLKASVLEAQLHFGRRFGSLSTWLGCLCKEEKHFLLNYLPAAFLKRIFYLFLKAFLEGNFVLGKTGLLVPPRDSGALKDAMLRICQDPDLARRLAKAGQEWARSTQLFAAFTQQLVDLYQSAAGQVPAP